MAASGACPRAATSECCGAGGASAARFLLFWLPAVLSMNVMTQLWSLSPSPACPCRIRARREVAKRCLWQKSCTVLADKSVFGDPCKGKPKRLTFQYRQARASSLAAALPCRPLHRSRGRFMRDTSCLLTQYHPLSVNPTSPGLLQLRQEAPLSAGGEAGAGEGGKPGQGPLLWRTDHHRVQPSVLWRSQPHVQIPQHPQVSAPRCCLLTVGGGCGGGGWVGSCAVA